MLQILTLSGESSFKYASVNPIIGSGGAMGKYAHGEL
jgi:hypothetical protein